MVLLSVETSSTLGSLELHNEKQSIYYCEWQKTHSELLTFYLEEALKKNNLQTSDINKLALSVGPGSFTGIRVAVNLVKSLGFALDIPIYVFDSLQVLAQSMPEKKERLVTMVNAFRNMVFFNIFSYQKNFWRAVEKSKVIKIEDLEKIITEEVYCLGDGLKTYEPRLSTSLLKRLKTDQQVENLPSARNISKLVLKSEPEIQTLVWQKVIPTYLRESAAEEKQKEGLLRPINLLT